MIENRIMNETVLCKIASQSSSRSPCGSWSSWLRLWGAGAGAGAGAGCGAASCSLACACWADWLVKSVNIRLFDSMVDVGDCIEAEPISLDVGSEFVYFELKP